MHNTEELLGLEARKGLIKGMERGFNLVAPTLGAVGNISVIDWEGLDPVIADDGRTILNKLKFKDKYENAGLKMLRKAAIRTSTEGGDGTATTTVLTYALVSEVFKELEKDETKVQEIKERLSKGLTSVISKLQSIKKEVTEEEIESIATISSLDKGVAKLIAETIKKVGINGVVTVEKSSKIGYSSEVVDGARFDSGLIAEHFVNEPEKERCVLTEPYIFLVDRKISINEQVSSVMKSLGETENKSILIIADDIDSLALASLIRNNNTVMQVDKFGNQKIGEYSIACVKNPYTGSRGKDFLHDIASLTGGIVISEEAGMKLKEATIKDCGKAEKVIVTKNQCTIIGGTSAESLKERISVIKSKIEETTSEYDKDMLSERLAFLTGGIGVIRVGAYTDQDFAAKKLKFDNAISSTQAALQEGILPGGGSALYQVAMQIDDPMFENALKVPMKQQAMNAGVKSDLDEVVSKGKGINFKTREEVDMFSEGVIDPFKVTRLVLESAVHIASTLAATSSAIIEVTDEKRD